jgi:glucose 1-dehydrogenase
MKPLEGKMALVTGAGKGVGSGIVIDLAMKGANVAIHYHSSIESAQKVVEEVKKTGVKFILIQADISDPEGMKNLIWKTKREFGKIDILVNNAAVQYNTKLDQYDENQITSVINTNLRGYLLGIKYVIPYMKEEKWGRIINISSIHAKRPITIDPGYGMSKGGIKMLTREAALEFARYGITVNAIDLGYVEVGTKTGNPPPVVTEEQLNQKQLFPYKNLFPWGRVTMPSDVGTLVSFLASDDSRQITGSSYRLDDGLVLL